MKIILVALILIISCSSAFGQQENFEDAGRLIQELSLTTSDTARIVLRSRLSEAYRSNNPDTSLILGNQALAKSRDIGFKKGEVMALNVLCVLNREKGDLPYALKLGLEAVKIAREEQLVNLEVNALIRVANVYLSVRDATKALPYLKKADELLNINYDDFQWSVTQFVLAESYEQLNQLDLAERRVELLEEKFGSVPWWIIINNRLRGNIASKREDFPQAIAYYRKSYSEAIVEKNFREAATASNAIADIFKKLDQPDSAIFYARQGLEFGEMLSYTNRILAASSLLAELYAEKDPTNAVRYYQIASAAKDSLYGVQKFQRLQSSTMEEKERQNEIESAAISFKNTQRQRGLIGGIAVFLIVAIFLYRNNRQKQKTNKVLETTLSNLKATQDQLVQQEKLASLGQLTAGIAHEIKNPLNFVNNFSEVSIEMIEEIMEARGEKREARDKNQESKSSPENRETKNQEKERVESEELEDEILEDIKSNLKKIHEHGSRANGIVTSMLQHSRGGDGKMEPTDLNALLKEYVNLSFHGMRAGKDPINVAIDLQLDEQIRNVPLVSEDFSRVLLNLCNNAFDAMREKLKMYNVPSLPAGKAGTMYQDGAHSEVNYLPKLKVTTKLEKGQVRISFEDNGTGIPDQIKDQILLPFFTTKKGTEGTGLGLSITNDIIKAHGGQLEIESSPETGARFIIFLSIQPK